jgi:hypothetical protein
VRKGGRKEGQGRKEEKRGTGYFFDSAEEALI